MNKEPKIDIRIAIALLTIILAGVGAVYAIRLADASEISNVKISATALSKDVEKNTDDIKQIAEKYDQILRQVEIVNAKADILLFDRGYDPKKITAPSP